MSTESYKHHDKRKHIPSKEEEGYEKANPLVNEKEVATYPKNPVVHRGQDPELMWLNKYGSDEMDDMLKVDIRSLYRHEHISPEVLIKNLYKLKEEESSQYSLDLNEMFGNSLAMEELEKVSEYYKHQDGWTNRMIQGDSLLVMNSLLEREGMAGKVQMVYFDPPYGIKYGGNWQMKISDKRMKDTDIDEQLSGEPEMIKAYRDTWELGIHSYLSYLRDRFIVANELLNESGSCFVQISDDNYHLARNVLDDVFGSECFIVSFPIKKKGGQKSSLIDPVNDYLIWYAKSPRGENLTKFRKLFVKRDIGEEILENGFSLFEIDRKDIRISQLKTPLGKKYDYLRDSDKLLADYPNGKIFKADQLQSGGIRKNQSLPFSFNGRIYKPKSGNCWKTKVQTDDENKPGMERLSDLNRFYATEKALYYRRYINDFGYKSLSNWWDNLGGVSDAKYVVQTNIEIVKRCIIMTTDPGDLVLDPTCGSGTTAYVAEQWGRRWITMDTSRIALNIAKTRLMTATLPYYKLYDDKLSDIRQGFIYKRATHITLKSLANNEPADEETLFDQPEVDNSKMRVAGPFTVETLQSFNPIAPEEAEESYNPDDNFEEKVFEHLKVAGVKTGRKDEKAVFIRIDPLHSEYLHAEGFYQSVTGERKAYIHIGPKFGTVSKTQVNDAIKECRQRGDADWLVILGFSFESNIQNESITASMGAFEVTKVRMHDDLMQDGLLKKDKKAASFVTIGEPDIQLVIKGDEVQAEIKGLDIYDPIKDEVKARNVHDIAYWMVDDDYDGSNFVVKQVFFCGGSKDEFNKWLKGLDDMAVRAAKRKVEKTLKIEIDDEAFDRLYGHISHPIPYKKGKKIAVRVISQFGEESMKVLEVK